MPSNAQNIINFGTSGLAIGDYTQSLYALSAPEYLSLYNQWSKYLVSSYPTLAGLINPVSTNVTFASGTTSLGTSTTWQTVAYGNGVWIAGSYNSSSIIRSTNNGTSWSATVSTGGQTGGQVAFGNNTFISVYTAGTGNYAKSIDNGLTWTSNTISSALSPNNMQAQNIAYGNGTWLMVGLGKNNVGTSTPANSIATSTTDGASWILRTAPFLTATAIYGNGVWVAVSWNGGEFFSRSIDNGVTWSAQASLPVALNCINRGLAYGNGNFVQVGLANSGGNYVATNVVNVSQNGGVSWTSYTMPSSQLWSGITFGNGVFVAVAGLNSINTGTATTVMATSPDGITWTQRVLGVSQVSSGIGAGDGGRFIVVSGHNSLSTSVGATVDFGVVATTFVLPNVTSTLTGAIPYIKAT